MNTDEFRVVRLIDRLRDFARLLRFLSRRTRFQFLGVTPLKSWTAYRNWISQSGHTGPELIREH